MKKTLLILALPLVAVACGKGGPEGDADKMCGMMEDWKSAKDAGKMEEAEKIEKEGRDFGKELKEKYKDDKEAMKTLEEKIEACEDKYIKGE